MKSNLNQLYISSDTHKRRVNEVQKFYDLYHQVYLNIWGDYENLVIHMGYYDEKVSSHEESMIRMNQIVCDIADIQQSDLVLDAGCGVGASRCCGDDLHEDAFYQWCLISAETIGLYVLLILQ